MSASRFEWHGDKVRARVQKAARFGINKTMAECVAIAKHSHPFKNRTGTAERSLRIALPAQTSADGTTIGLWGSLAVGYFWFLEFGTKHSEKTVTHMLTDSQTGGKRKSPGDERMEARPTLRPTAKKVYPRLGMNIGLGWKRA